MKNKTAILSKLEEVADLLTKCGGPGGTPGPCPSGGGSKPTGSKEHLEHFASQLSFGSKMKYDASGGGFLTGQFAFDKKAVVKELQQKFDLKKRQGDDYYLADKKTGQGTLFQFDSSNKKYVQASPFDLKYVD